MVYEIVACLPLLLQLSLGLFFVGLCYFTASVHESVGHTTFPLVIGWAMFFFGATALPIFIPHCPYRTTLLKTGIGHLHHKLSCLAQHIVSQRDVIFLKGTYLSNPMFDFPEEFLSWFDMQYRQYRYLYGPESYQRHCETYQLWLITQFTPFSAIYAAAAQVVMTVVTTCSGAACNALAFILLNIPTRWQDWQSIVSPLLSWESWYLCYVKYFVRGMVALQDIPKEEELVKEVSSDVEILKSVDAIQANDDMLETTFREALQYIHPKPEYKEILGFIFRILSHRLPTLPASERVLPEWPFDGFAPLGSLRPQARAAVSNIIVDHISGTPYYSPRPEFTIQAQEDQSAFTTIYGLTLMLSIFTTSDKPELSPAALSNIRDYSDKQLGCRMIEDVLLLTTCKGKKNIWENGTTLLTALTRIWKLAKPKRTLKNGTAFFKAIQSELAKLQQRPDEDFDWKSWSWPENAPQEFQDICVQYLCTVVSAAPEHLNLQDKDSQEMLRNVLACSSRLIRTPTTYGRSEDAEQSFQQLIAFVMKSKLTVNMVITCWMSGDNAWKREYDQEMINYVVGIPYNLPPNTAGVEKCRELFVPIIPQIQSLSSGQPTEQGREETVDAIEGHEDQQQASDATKLVKACLYLMAYEHGRGYVSYWDYDEWLEKFRSSNTIFPDDLVDTLGKLIVRQDDDELYRLRELEERKQRDESAEASEVELQSEHNEKAISGRFGTGVGGSDQESPVDDKTMEIDRNREGLVGLAVGDDGSVGFEGVTGIDDVAKALHLPTSDGTAPSTRSGHNAQATAPISTQAQDEISNTPNEEANVNKTAASDAPTTLGHVVPQNNTQAGESSGSGQG
ncbi:hypothetical protein BC629DRAFT_1441423 [Irpex lacteus]|nr:hypothetical protein BC629DRAFT_1441423 [Irpex lacteus]